MWYGEGGVVRTKPRNSVSKSFQRMPALETALPIYGHCILTSPLSFLYSDFEIRDAISFRVWGGLSGCCTLLFSLCSSLPWGYRMKSVCHIIILYKENYLLSWFNEKKFCEVTSVWLRLQNRWVRWKSWILVKTTHKNLLYYLSIKIYRALHVFLVYLVRTSELTRDRNEREAYQ